MPSVFGEDAVLRILDRQHLADELHGLSLLAWGSTRTRLQSSSLMSPAPWARPCYRADSLRQEHDALRCACKNAQTRRKSDHDRRSVEYQIDGILQIPVNERKGFTFARGLRSTLRHDPDRVLVGGHDGRSGAASRIASSHPLDGCGCQLGRARRGDVAPATAGAVSWDAGTSLSRPRRAHVVPA